MLDKLPHITMILVAFAPFFTTARPSTEIKIGGSHPVSVQMDSNTPALLLLIGSGHDYQVTQQGQQGHKPDCEKEKLGEVRNCLDVQKQGFNESGVYTVRPYSCCPGLSVDVFCDMDTDGGGWTVFQRRDENSPQENFFRTWEEYNRGFGNLSSEFWLGLSHIHALLNQTAHEARVDLWDFDGNMRFAKYGIFTVDDEAHGYKLTAQDYTGDAGNALDHHDGRKFSTKDRDNDDHSTSCATRYRGAWWYGACHNSNLNGEYLHGKTGSNLTAQGIIWEHFTGDNYSLKKTEIKIRPRHK